MKTENTFNKIVLAEKRTFCCIAYFQLCLNVATALEELVPSKFIAILREHISEWDTGQNTLELVETAKQAKPTGQSSPASNEP